METKLEINSLEALRTAIFERLKTLNRKVNTYKDYWVVAGYGGETMYAYVGIDDGYFGSGLAACSARPLLFKDDCEANSFANNLHFYTQRFEPINLQAHKASSYFSFVIKELEKALQTIDTL